jgi:hypothetical protein
MSRIRTDCAAGFAQAVDAWAASKSMPTAYLCMGILSPARLRRALTVNSKMTLS